MLVDGLQAFLTADSNIQAMLGTSTTRSDKTTGIFYSVALEQCNTPYLVYQQVSGGSLDENFQGTGNLQTSRWRFSCYGNTARQAKQLAKFLKLAMFSLNGPMPGTAAKTEVHGCWLRLEMDETEPMTKATMYSTHVDFEINFTDLDVS